ncbi:phosphatidylserine/phosphatidylglycerophosphate/cardiolipin synthase family protein [Halomonas sp. McH1-25]|uniref:phospholipase D-like domain-containing protein n=1 Tax=unclassified Halomonas TaxID=2609666 RepID=UPI001EF67ECF|nr:MULTISPECIES: phosphatidylserine/phosphatidylglycerophosphate/cardiolipin synthase family protein [unclassified Halomonas]MCG7600722.1 phosphatidylserine/phosphatidylglycerophosphate/cardiolipin synthase family protein [Halomonas sp. McH1-25]MCP1341300.1 phosphatidylserine/phosphatidylglycerophosphate/cardiolipin synthase family protein [Halomonas sp. FL8]MCP1362396.1 phosphatidylserine/phosphatidylglycerophosphate/cardiolipin synthase family protein [Halomonas sp. BBD45]MCP1364920.1 phospha
MALRKRATESGRRRRGTWRDGNRFTLLAEGRRYLPAMEEAIAAARSFIVLELYLMESGRLAGRLIERLVDAAQRGVDVLVLLDGLGSMGLDGKDRDTLREAGVVLRFFNPLAWGHLGNVLMRDHRKLLIVDGKVAFTGGFGAVDEFIDAWFDVAVRIEGPVVADWLQLFARLWGSPLTRGDGEPALVQRLTAQGQPARERPMLGRVMWGQGYRYQAIRHSLHQRVMTARQRIWVCTPYFVPTLTLRRRLARAARRGVDVRLLLPGDAHDHPGVRYAGQRFYGRLLRAGVRIYEYQPGFIHAKISLVDTWVSVGSCNFDHWSLQWNLEANQEVLNSAFADEAAALFERNFAVSREILPAAWAQRSRRHRLREWIFGTLDSWVTRLR